MRKIIFLVMLSFFFIVLTTTVCAAFTITILPNEVTQDTEEQIITIQSSAGLDEPTTWPEYYNPYVAISGGTGVSIAGDGVIFQNALITVVTIKVDPDASLGSHTLTLYADDGTSITSAGATLTVISKPKITGVTPEATFKGVSDEYSLVVHGNYFVDGGAEAFSMPGSGISQTDPTKIAVDASGTMMTISELDISETSGVVPGGPYPVQIVNGDGGEGISSTGDGAIDGKFTLYPKPEILSVEKTSVHQGEQGAKFRILATGLTVNSVVNVSETASYDDAVDIGVTEEVDAETGIINVTLNVDVEAAKGDRWFWILNPDGNSGDANKSDPVEKSNFVTYQYIPEIDAGTSTSTVKQGYKGIITFKASGDEQYYGFDSNMAVTDVIFSGTGITVNDVIVEDASTLNVDITVDPQATANARIATVKNPLYNTQASAIVYVEEAEETKLADTILTLSPDELFQGESSTITVTCADGASFEVGATAAIGGDDVDIKHVTFISTSTLWLYLDTQKTAVEGQRTLTITNPTYGVEKSAYFTVSDAAYTELGIVSIDPNDLTQGETSTITVTCSGKLEDVPTVIFGGTGLTLNTVTKMSDTLLWLHVTVGGSDNLGQHSLTISNPNYNVSVSSFITVSTSIYSNPAITGINKPVLYQGDITDIEIIGHGFAQELNFSFSNSNISILNTVRKSSSSVILSVNVQEETEPGDYSISVENVAYKASTIAEDILTIKQKHVITSISPSTLIRGATEDFYINGQGFDNTSDFNILIDNKLVPTSITADTYDDIVFLSSACNSAEQVVCQIYIGTAAATGLHDLGLFFETRGTTDTTTGAITIPNIPVIDSISGSLVQGDVNKELTIQGKNFESEASIIISGAGVTVTTRTVISSSIISFRCTVLESAEATSRQLTVLNRTGQSAEATLKVIAPPSITGCSPEGVFQGTTNYITVEGDNFGDYCMLAFSGATNYGDSNISSDAITLLYLDEAQTKYVDFAGDEYLTAKIYVGTNVAVGLHNIKVINYEDAARTVEEAAGLSTGLLNIRAPITIDYVDPPALPYGVSDRDLYITGTGFVEDMDADDISIGNGDVQVTQVYRLTANSIRLIVDVPQTVEVGDKEIVISDEGAKTETDGIFKIITPVSVTGINPNEVGIGVREKQLTITGAEFKDGAEVKIGGLGVTVSSPVVATPTQMTIYVSVDADAVASPRYVRVINSDENEGTAENLLFIKEKVKVNIIEPTYFTLTPNTTYQDVVIRGDGFKRDDTLTQVPAVEFLNPALSVDTASIEYDDYDQLRATVWIDTVTAQGGTESNVRVTNPDGTTGEGASVCYLTDPLSLTRVIPDNLGKGAFQEKISIQGDGFIDGIRLEFQDNDNITVEDSITYLGPNEITAVISITSSTTIGFASFTLINPGNVSISTTTLFTVTDAPVIYSVTPNSYSQGARDQTLVIRGADFSVTNTTVSIPGVYISNTEIDAEGGTITLTLSVDLETGAGLRDITITSDGEDGVGRDIFEITGAPEISQIEPQAMLQGSSDRLVSIEGSGFKEGAHVSLINSDGVDAAGVTIKSTDFIGPNKIEIVIDIHDGISVPGFYGVKVENLDGSKKSKDSLFEIKQPPSPPSLENMSPNMLVAGSQQEHIVISGSNFQQGMVVSFAGAGISVSTMSVIDFDQAIIVVNVDELADGGSRNVTLSNPDGGIKTIVGGFEVLVIPTITGITPNAISNDDTIKEYPSVLLEGTGFLETSSVTVSGDGIYVAETTYIGGGQLELYLIVYSSSRAGDHDVIVDNPHGLRAVGSRILNISEPIRISPSAEPIRVPQGATNRTVLISGSGFKEGATAVFSGGGIVVSDTAYLGPTQLSVLITVAADADKDTRFVTVTNPDKITLTSDSPVLQIVEPMVIDGVNPDELGIGRKDATLTVTGNGFEQGATVEISGAGIDVSSYTTFMTEREIKVDIIAIPDDIEASVQSLTVRNPNGDKQTLSNALSIIEKVTVDGAYEDYMIQDSTEGVSIRGTGFQMVNGSTPSITIVGGGLGLTVSDVQWVSSIELRAKFTASADAVPGSREIKITNGDGTTGRGSGIFEVAGPLAIDTIDPNTLGRGVTNETIELRGSGFIEGATVEILTNDIELIGKPEYITQEQINIVVNVIEDAAYEDYDITIRNPKGAAITGTLTIDKSPVITQIIPSALSKGALEQQIIVHGVNLSSATRVEFSDSGIDITELAVYDSSLTFNATVGQGATPGTKNIIITNNDGTFGTSKNVFTIDPEPTVDGADYSSIDQGKKDVIINVYGTGFKDGIRASLDHASLVITTVTYISPGIIELKLDASLADIRSYNVTVTNPDGSNGTGTNIFNVVRPPSITGCSPDKLPAGKQDQEVIILGTNFETQAGVFITGGGIHITTKTVNSPSSITIRVNIDAAAEPGERTIKVTNQNGSDTGDTGHAIFEITPKPIIQTVIPEAMIRGHEGWVIIGGTGFYGTDEQDPLVEFFNPDGITISSMVYNSLGEIKVYIELSQDIETGHKDIQITNADDSVAYGEKVLQIVAPIDVIGVIPSRIPQGDSNRSITIKGQGFLDRPTVKFGGGGITIQGEPELINDEEISLVINVASDAEIEGRQVTVENENKTSASKSGLFDIVDPIIVESIYPANIGQGRNDKEMIVKGSGFSEGAEVRITGAGITVSTISYSTTEIGIKVSVLEDALLGPRDVEIINVDENKGTGVQLLTVDNSITISEVKEAYLTRGSSDTIYIKGSGFDISSSTPTISISGTGLSLGDVEILGTTELSMQVIAASTANIGARDIIIKNADGTIGRGNGIFTISQELNIIRLEPDSLGKGSKEETISIFGTGFVQETDVVFNYPGIAVPAGGIEYIGTEQLNVKVSIEDTFDVGQGPVSSSITASNPNGATKTTGEIFTVTDAPVIKEATPDSISQGARNQNIVVEGVNFSTETGTKISISGNGITIISTATAFGLQSITVQVSIDKAAIPGARDIVVTNPSNAFGIGKGVISITAGPAIDYLSPSSMDQGAIGKEIYVIGSGFRENPIVEIDASSVAVTATYISNERIKLIVDAFTETPIGNYDITVTNQDKSDVTGVALFSITPPPQVTALGTPEVGRGETNKIIDVFGSDFKEGASVFIEGLQIDAVNFVSSVKLSVLVTVPEDISVGSKDVRVTNPNGSVGIGEKLLTVLAEEPILKNVGATSHLIDYEQNVGLPLEQGTTISFDITAPCDQIELSITKTTGEEVKKLTLYNVAVGTTSSFYWDGSIDFTNTEELTATRKINGEYSYTVTAYAQEKQEAITSNESIVVEVVNISDAYVEYTEIGDEKAKVGPYKLHYTLSKAAYVSIDIYNSSTSVLTRSFSGEQGQQGLNIKSWDGRDSRGVRVDKGLYKAVINAHDESLPIQDSAYDKSIDISVDQLRVVDIKVEPIQDDSPDATVSFVAAETMFIELKIYKPGTEFNNISGAPGAALSSYEPVDPGARVKTFNLFLEKGTTYYATWDGTDDQGDMLRDGDYIFVISGQDSYGNVITDPYIGALAIRRATDIGMRRTMFKINSYGYPNPVDMRTANTVKVNYVLNNIADLDLYVYDIVGDLIWSTHLDNASMGEGYIEWPLMNMYGTKIERGLYVYVMEAYEIDTGEKLRATNKIMVIK